MNEIKIDKYLYFSLSSTMPYTFHNQINFLFSNFDYYFIHKIREVLNYDINILNDLEMIIEGINYDIS